MRAEYFRLSEKGLADAKLLAKLGESYQVMVNRTDPLQKHRGDKVPKEWDCPKVRRERERAVVPPRVLTSHPLVLVLVLVLELFPPRTCLYDTIVAYPR